MKYLKIGECEIKIAYFEGFSKKATITMPIEDNLKFEKIIEIFKSNDLSSLKFYENEGEVENLIGELEGYVKVIGYTSNLESNLSTINLEKPNLNNMSLEELKAYILGGE